MCNDQVMATLLKWREFISMQCRAPLTSIINAVLLMHFLFVFSGHFYIFMQLSFYFDTDYLTCLPFAVNLFHQDFEIISMYDIFSACVKAFS